MEIIEKYNLKFENTNIPVVIYQKEGTFVPVYEVGILQVGKYTEFIISKIKEDLLREGIFDSTKSENRDISYEDLKKGYVKKVEELLEYYVPMLDYDEKNRIVTYIVQKSLDLGFVDILISDPGLEEITINGGTSEVMVYHRRHGWLKTNLSFLSDEEIINISTRIAMDNKKFFSNLSPLLDAHLRGGHRVNATMNPISTKGATITIRRFSDDPWTVPMLMKAGTSSSLPLAIIWAAIENELSVIVAGGTGSGKTSFLNAISCFIPADQRIISVEDTREIRLPKYSHWVPMEARQKNQEGRGEISILDLIVNSLRMRPDRIIIGEIRKKTEAEVLFEAMRTGHSVYGTFHANTAEETILRLSSSPIEIPKITLSALGLICIQHRDRRTGKRFTLQIAEVDENGDERVILQYNIKEGKYHMKNKPKMLIKKLEEFQGITEREFAQDIKNKMIVLEYLKESGVEKIEDVGRVINTYNKNPKEILEKANYLLDKKKKSENQKSLNNSKQKNIIGK